MTDQASILTTHRANDQPDQAVEIIDATASRTTWVNDTKVAIGAAEVGFLNARIDSMVQTMASRWSAFGVKSANALIPTKIGAEADKVKHLCESPIELQMLYALLTASWDNDSAFIPGVFNCKVDVEWPNRDVIIVPQMPLIRFRTDFTVILKRGGRMKFVVIECDGRDFHNDAEKDHTRDTVLRGIGAHIFRVDGRASHFNAIASASMIVGATQGWSE